MSKPSVTIPRKRPVPDEAADELAGADKGALRLQLVGVAVGGQRSRRPFHVFRRRPRQAAQDAPERPLASGQVVRPPLGLPSAGKAPPGARNNPTKRRPLATCPENAPVRLAGVGPGRSGPVSRSGAILPSSRLLRAPFRARPRVGTPRKGGAGLKRGLRLAR